ncbi:MAG: metal ABC transporter substrate-binding protein [Leifsonia sp.]|nr:metal ABC transporter substrate-binding protein [Leifsonia sp.]|tara:strand:- start:4395 stop:5330 length:936 start_codon:yes stop_codon:yes gene_type:complete
MPKLWTQVRRRTNFVAATGLAFALGLSGCTADSSTPDPADDRPVVLTTFTVLADLAQNVAGEHLRVESITKVGSEIHGYEPTPGDLRTAASADLILDNGLGLEAWFAQFIDQLEVPHVVLGDTVTPIPIGGTGAPNPHAWMSTTEAESYIATIATAFAELDPSHADDFTRNAENYAAELRALHDELLTALDGLPENHRALVTCEGAFSYLARDAGLTEQYLWPVNAEQEATPQQIAAVIDFVTENDVPAVFCESTVSDRAMQQVVEATGATFGGTLYVDSLSEADGPVPTYLELLRHDVDLIIAGLSGTEA